MNKNHFFPNSTNKVLDRLIDEYARNGSPINTRFRDLVDWLPNADRATHLIHSYPAKLLMHIPHFFLSNKILSQQGDTILDPFCGSGTVLLEALLSGRHSIGVDSNPLARLISEVKITAIDEKKIKKASDSLFNRILPHGSYKVPDVVNIDYWFFPHVQKQLTCILEAIKKIRDSAVRDFFLVCFSTCVRRVSLADPHLSVPVKLRSEKYPAHHRLHNKTVKHLRRLKRINVKNEFLNVVSSNLVRINQLDCIPEEVKSEIICSNARNLIYEFSQNGNGYSKLGKDSVQLVITSPPYVGAQKYVRSSSLNLGWLELCSSNELREYETATIGREHYLKQEYSHPTLTGIDSADRVIQEVYKMNPLRAYIASNYLNEMKDAFGEISGVVKPGGYLVLVVGNNIVCHKEFETQEYLRQIIENAGFTLILRLIDDIRSRGLMTKRNKTASVITREWIHVFKKDGKWKN